MADRVRGRLGQGELEVAERPVGEGADPGDAGQAKPAQGDVLRAGGDRQPNRWTAAVRAHRLVRRHFARFTHRKQNKTNQTYSEPREPPTLVALMPGDGRSNPLAAGARRA